MQSITGQNDQGGLELELMIEVGLEPSFDRFVWSQCIEQGARAEGPVLIERDDQGLGNVCRNGQDRGFLSCGLGIFGVCCYGFAGVDKRLYAEENIGGTEDCHGEDRSGSDWIQRVAACQFRELFFDGN